MSRIITLIAAVGTAFAVAVPGAFGRPDPGPQQDPATDVVVLGGGGLGRAYQGNFVGQDPATVAVILRSEALGRAYQKDPNLGRTSGTVDPYGPSTVAVRKAIEAQEQQKTSMLDAREEAFVAKREAQLRTGTPPDVFERAVAARQADRDDYFLASDERFRLDASNLPGRTTVSATDSGREIDWPQLGIGFGIGIALILGLLLGLWASRHRPVAH